MVSSSLYPLIVHRRRSERHVLGVAPCGPPANLFGANSDAGRSDSLTMSDPSPATLHGCAVPVPPSSIRSTLPAPQGLSSSENWTKRTSASARPRAATSWASSFVSRSSPRASRFDSPGGSRAFVSSDLGLTIHRGQLTTRPLPSRVAPSLGRDEHHADRQDDPRALRVSAVQSQHALSFLGLARTRKESRGLGRGSSAVFSRYREGWSAKSTSCRRVAMVTAIWTSAKPFPRHRWGPSPKGAYA